MLQIDSGKLHHAYCIEGERGKVLAEVCLFCEEKLRHATRGNPDFWMGEFDSLGIDEGRAIKEMQEKKALGGGKKVFVISANSITHQAQNSLLKVFEEPTLDTHFFLIMPSAEVLLPTLRSRLQIISFANNSLGGLASKWEDSLGFLKKSPAERLVFVKDFAEDISDEKRTKAEAIVLVNGIEVLLRKNIGDRALTKEEVSVFEEMLKVRDYLQDRSASVKMLLEHLSLILPR